MAAAGVQLVGLGGEFGEPSPAGVGAHGAGFEGVVIAVDGGLVDGQFAVDGGEFSS
jgi:hypothetical protein